ncbi:MAG TPA: PEP/pyruvate-binding domain-containing protein [Candidatus Eisenbacteria bacterium]
MDLTRAFPEFDRRFFESHEDFTLIGSGGLGGKAQGLARVKRMLETSWSPERHPEFEVGIPRLTVLATDVFDRFLDENALRDVVRSGGSDDETIARSFQRASLPASVVGDLRGFVERVHRPIAVRSSSLLEDEAERPFAGVYATKMIPNNQLDAESRFRRLTEAIKFVYASTYFGGAKEYLAAAGGGMEEKMAVILQEVVGRRHGDRFYPDVSGVARSWNFYAASGARPEEGTATLALGLGKTIVDGGVAWSYSPAWPRANPPVASARDLLDATQTRFWSVNMGAPPAYDPVVETEYLLPCGLAEAEEDGVLGPLASTYDRESDRLRPGIGARGARVLTFAPILVQGAPPLNDVVRAMLDLAETTWGAPMEIEFAAALDEPRPGAARVGFLQARPLAVAPETGAVTPESLAAPGVVIASESVLGRGRSEELADVVFVRRQTFAPARSLEIAAEIERMNRALLAAGRRYVLVGFGRWGSADPWLGIPVRWGQISGASVIVEASLPGAEAAPSQGSHFFHNMTGAGVAYFTVRHTGHYAIDWAWLDAQPAVSESAHVRHVRLAPPLVVETDGRSGRGVIRRAAPAPGDRP